VAERTPVIVRKRVARQADVVSAAETGWIPVEIAVGTDLEQAEPLRNGIRRHLQAVKHLRFDHITERLSARKSAKDKAELLGSSSPVLAVTATVHDPAGSVLLAMSLALPGSLHELEDVDKVS
jgi:DNA-binding GntR family transcriptional regulator